MSSLLTNELICTLAAWAKENTDIWNTGESSIDVKDKFIFSLFFENRKAGFHEVFLSSDEIEVVVPFADYERVCEAEYHKKLTPIEIAGMCSKAAMQCKINGHGRDFIKTDVFIDLCNITAEADSLARLYEFQIIINEMGDSGFDFNFDPFERDSDRLLIENRNVLSPYNDKELLVSADRKDLDKDNNLERG